MGHCDAESSMVECLAGYKGSMKAAAILTGFVLLAVTLGFAAQKPPRQFCTTDGRRGSVMCYCLSFHPDFCTEEGPIPSCCKVAEEGSKAHECDAARAAGQRRLSRTGRIHTLSRELWASY